MNLTEKELAVLKAIDASEYGDVLSDAVWSFTIADNSKLPKASIGGIVASLQKKGLVVASEYEPGESTISMTTLGIDIYVVTIGRANVRKLIRQ